MSDARKTPEIGFVSYREIEETVRRAEIARADYIADALGRFFSRLRGKLDRPAQASAAAWDRLGEPVDRKTTVEVG